LILSQVGGACIGMAAAVALGPGYVSAGSAMVLAIVAMIVLDAVHPPAVATTLGFGLKAGDATNLALFLLALAITVALLGLQRLSLWMVKRWRDG
jgi:CBS-domain-containing membrane protein